MLKLNRKGSVSALSIVTTNSARGAGPGFEFDDTTSIGGISRTSCLFESEAFAEEDDGEEAWRNMAEEIFKKRRGDEEYEYGMKKQFKYPAPWLGSQLALKFASVRLKSLQKMTHAVSGTFVGATGFCTVFDNPDIHRNPFFVPGRMFRVRMRFSNCTIKDDAGVDIRGAAIKLEEVGKNCKFDLLLETGRHKFIENAAHEITYLRSTILGAKGPEEYILHSPRRLFAYLEAIRRAPLSFSMMTYYTKVTYVINTDDDLKRYVRFRLVPAGPVKDSGLLKIDDQLANWMKRERLPGETRTADYLRKGIKSRLRRRPVKFYLEMQTKELKGDKEIENTCNVLIPWDDSIHPWCPLAEVTLTTSMLDAVCRSTPFALSSHPPCFTFSSAKSKYDPNSLAFVHEKSSDCGHMVGSDETDGGATYHVHLTVETLLLKKSDVLRMKLVLYGPEGSTSPADVVSFAQPLIPVANVTANIQSPDIGDPFALEIILESESDVIALHEITVMNKRHEPTAKIEIHKVIASRGIVAVCEAMTCLREQHPFLLELRKIELQQKQGIYGWIKINTLPARLTVKQNEISRDFIPMRNITQTIDAMFRTCDTKLELHMNFLLDTDFGDYAQSIFPFSNEVKRIADGWHTDVEYVNQFLSPSMFMKRCKGLPRNFALDARTAEGVMGKGLTLDSEIKAGRVYLADYSFLTPLTPLGGRGIYYCAPIAAFHVTDEGNLVPLAVQLGQNPGEVWTPTDPEEDWQLAKAYVKCADQQADLIYHSMLSRIVEAVANATLRKLPSLHPIHNLLMPYLRPILSMNMSSREVLSLVEKITGIHRRLYSRIGEYLYRSFHIDQQFVPNCFEAVGTHDPQTLPYYPFREEALRAWNDISTHVTDILEGHYTQNDDVTNDEEVQSWVREIYRDALPQYDEEGYRYSGKIKTVNQLTSLITWMIFEASFRLPALTTNIWERPSVIPNAPLVMKRAPPVMKGLVQTMTLMTSFPSRLDAPPILALCTLFQEFASKFRAFSRPTKNSNAVTHVHAKMGTHARNFSSDVTDVD